MKTKILTLGWIVILLLLACHKQANAVSFLLPKAENDLVGKTLHVTVKQGDTLTKIAARFDVGRRAILQANTNINHNRLKIGQHVIVPLAFILPAKDYRHSIVINIPELRLYHFTENDYRPYIASFPVALGRAGWRTPTTITTVRKKRIKPNWYVPKSIKRYTYEKTGKWLPDVIGPGPQNPLGDYAIYLQKWGYLIHGTNNPGSIGTLASSGCIRMYNKDIQALFTQVHIGDKVSIIHHPYKAGWRNNTLYLEVHAPVSHNEEISPLNYVSVEDAIMEATMYRHATVNWEAVEKAVSEETGVPQPIGHSNDH